MPTEEYGIRLTARDETKKAVTSAGKSVASLAKTYAGLAAGAATAFLVIRRGVQYAKSAVEASSKQQLAENQLAIALANTGQASAENLVHIKAYASELQGLTTVGDETTLQNLALAVSMGAPVEMLDDLAAALAGAQAAGIPAQTMLRGLTASLSGSAGMLSRYVPAVRDLTEAELRNGEAITLVKDQFFAMAQAERQTFTGAVKALSNAWGDFKEAQGSVITNSPILLAALGEVTTAVSAQADATNQAANSGRSMVDDTLLALIDTAPAVIWAVTGIREGINLVRFGFDGFIAAFQAGWTNLATITVGGAILIGRALEKLGIISSDAVDPLANALKRMQVSTRESIQAVKDDVQAFGEIKDKARETIQALADHRQSIMDNAAAIREQGVPENKSMGDALVDLGVKAKAAAEKVHELSTTEMRALIAETRASITMLVQMREELKEFAPAEVGGQIADVNSEIVALSNKLIALEAILGETKTSMRAALGAVRGMDWGLSEDEIASWDRALEGQQALEEAKIRYIDRIREEQQAQIDSAMATADAWATTYRAINDLIKTAVDAKIDAAKDGTAAEKREALDAFYAMKAFAIAQAAIDTALAIINAMTVTPPQAGVALAIAAGVTGAVSTAAIAAEQPPSFQEGGFVTGPGPKGVDSVNAVLAPGEYVINARTMDELLRSFARGQIGHVTQVNDFRSFVPESPSEFARKYITATDRLDRKMRAMRRI